MAAEASSNLGHSPDMQLFHWDFLFQDIFRDPHDFS